jgi:hypothetical protein
MELSSLPLPAEPVTVKTATRTLLEQAPEVGLATVASGEWVAAPLWIDWQRTLTARGIDWPAFLRIVAEYRNELRLWVMGERPWDQCVAGLAGRVIRRSTRRPTSRLSPASDRGDEWSGVLARVEVDQASDLPTLDHAIQRLGLHYSVAASGLSDSGEPNAGASAVVWAGDQRRDPEVPYGEATSAVSPAAALAEALARFLIKDPGFPVPPSR